MNRLAGRYTVRGASRGGVHWRASIGRGCGVRHLVQRCAVLCFAVVLLLPTNTLAQQTQTSPSFRSPTDEELTSTRNGGVNWITYGGALNNQRYSMLDQINTSNVQNLR